MAAKVFTAAVLLVLIVGGMLFFMNMFVDTVENFIFQTAEIIEAPDISAGIDAFYSFEESFYESETFVSLFVHDSVLDEIRESMVEIRTSFFNGERDDALVFTSLLRERFLQIRRSVQPTAANIF